MDATTEAPDAAPDAAPEGDTAAMGLGMDAANPQVVFKALRDGSPVLALEGAVLLSRKADIDETLRHPETFTSNMSAVNLKNVRPLIPLQIDPPDHKKYRKLLDPIFAPRIMTAMEEEVAVLVNDLIDRFIDRGEVDFAAEFSVPYPSQVFLTLLGLPLDELDRFLAMKDGICLLYTSHRLHDNERHGDGHPYPLRAGRVCPPPALQLEHEGLPPQDVRSPG